MTQPTARGPSTRAATSSRHASVATATTLVRQRHVASAPSSRRPRRPCTRRPPPAEGARPLVRRLRRPDPQPPRAHRHARRADARRPRRARRARLDTLADDHAWIDELLGDLGDALGVLSFGLGAEAWWLGKASDLAAALATCSRASCSARSALLTPLVARWLRRRRARRRAPARRVRAVATGPVRFSLAWLYAHIDDDERAARPAASRRPAACVADRAAAPTSAPPSPPSADAPSAVPPTRYGRARSARRTRRTPTAARYPAAPMSSPHPVRVRVQAAARRLRRARWPPERRGDAARTTPWPPPTRSASRSSPSSTATPSPTRPSAASSA